MATFSIRPDSVSMQWRIHSYFDFQLEGHCAANNRQYIGIVLVGGVSDCCCLCCEQVIHRNFYIRRNRYRIVNTFSSFRFISTRSTEEGADGSYWRRNEITVVVTAISFFFPMFFEGLGFLESYHPRKQLRMQLARYVDDHCHSTNGSSIIANP